MSMSNISPLSMAGAARRARAAANGAPIPTPGQMRANQRRLKEAERCSMPFPAQAPVIIDDSRSVNQLVDYLLRPQRSRPMVVLTLCPGDRRPWSNPDRLFHDFDIDVALITDSSTNFTFTDGIGRDFTVFNGAAQVYPSDSGWLDGEDMPNRIMADGSKGPMAFDKALRRSIANQIEREAGFGSYADRMAAAGGADAGSDADDGMMMTSEDGSIIGYSSTSSADPRTEVHRDAADVDVDALIGSPDEDDDMTEDQAVALVSRLTATANGALVKDLLRKVRAERRRNAQLRVRLAATDGDLAKARDSIGQLDDALAQQGGRYRTMRGHFADDGERLRFERDRFAMWVREEWALRVKASEKASKPLPAHWECTADFFDMMEATQVDRAAVVKAVVKVLLGELRDCHPCRTGKGGNNPPRRDAEGDIIWRFYVERQTANAHRLHFVRRGDGTIVFRFVGGHDDEDRS